MEAAPLLFPLSNWKIPVFDYYSISLYLLKLIPYLGFQVMLKSKFERTEVFLTIDLGF